MKTIVLRSIFNCVPVVAACCFIFGITYLGLQQYIRLSADEVLVQYAEDTRANLEKGHPTAGMFARLDTVNMAYSLSPFIMLYNSSGNLVTTNSILNGHTAAMPKGAVLAARMREGSRITWQPQTGVRNATVILPYSGGYVVAGRSIRETEDREAFLLSHMLAGFIVTATIVFITTFLLQLIKHRYNHYDEKNRYCLKAAKG